MDTNNKMLTKKRAHEILTTYGQAWVEQDTQKILSIFTQDATYAERAFKRPHTGHEEIAAYWNEKVCTEQSKISFSLLALYVESDTIIAEWEAFFESNIKHERIHLKEVGILETKNGLVVSLREYWQSEKTALDFDLKKTT